MNSVFPLFAISEPADWADHAICKTVDPEIFYPENGAQNNEAKRVCFTCPVRAECLAHAMTHSEIGIWGGTSEYDRRLLRRGINPARRARGVKQNGHTYACRCTRCVR